MVIVVPEEMNVSVYFKGGLASVDADREWDRSGDKYSLDGDGPSLIIHVDIGAGSLELRVD